MDPRFTDGAEFCLNENLLAGERYGNVCIDQNFRELNDCVPVHPTSSNVDPSSSLGHEEDSPDDGDLSDAMLGFITQMLMEEDMEDQTCMLQESLEFQAAEKSFYEVIGKKYPSTPERNTCENGSGYENLVNQSSASAENCCCTNDLGCISYGGHDGRYDAVNATKIHNRAEFSTSQLKSPCVSFPTHSFRSSSNNIINHIDRPQISAAIGFHVPDLCPESQPIWQFQKGVEEASKFLPSNNELSIKLDVNGFSLQEPKRGKVGLFSENKEVGELSPGLSRCRKNSNREDEDLDQGRNAKHAAISIETPLRSKMIDNILLYSTGEGRQYFLTVLETLQSRTSKNVPHNRKVKGTSARKGRTKRQGMKREVVDLRNLLIACAQAIAADDYGLANELLRQIKQHSSPFGDANQRLAHCFAQGLDARLAGIGSQIYKGLISKKISAADVLKAYHLFIAASPFGRISNFASVRTIRALAKNSMRVHVIDFGILYGFQWPTLIQRFSKRDGGTPKLKITGIEFPQPGFRPAERVEETGRRLEEYAKQFNVPFEYNAIAKNWEYIQVEDFDIDPDEVVVVNCFRRFENLSDEAVEDESSRDVVLKLIKRIKPDIFLQEVINGAYSIPFFVTRFREALFHFSSLFDMLETIVPRENPERLLLETEIFGREALNVIACEGWERVERPETYKQWQVRNLKAGFVQVPFDGSVLNPVMNSMRFKHHADFLIYEDGKWLLQGWKGRIIYALSAWKPA